MAIRAAALARNPQRLSRNDLLLHALNSAIAYDTASCEDVDKNDPGVIQKRIVIAQMEELGNKILEPSVSDILAWPDRVGIGFAWLLGLLMILFAAWEMYYLRDTPGPPSTRDLALAWPKYIGITEMAVALPIWLIARTIHFMVGGKKRFPISN